MLGHKYKYCLVFKSRVLRAFIHLKQTVCFLYIYCLNEYSSRPGNYLVLQISYIFPFNILSIYLSLNRSVWNISCITQNWVIQTRGLVGKKCGFFEKEEWLLQSTLAGNGMWPMCGIRIRFRIAYPQNSSWGNG